MTDAVAANGPNNVARCRNQKRKGNFTTKTREEHEVIDQIFFRTFGLRPSVRNKVRSIVNNVRTSR